MLIEKDVLDFIGQVLYFTPIFIFFYGFYCSMNMEISPYYYRKYKWQAIIAFVLFFLNIGWLIYNSII